MARGENGRCVLRLLRFALIPVAVVFANSCGVTKPPPSSGLEGNKFKVLTIHNAEPRRDLAGEIIDAHDGCLQFFGDRYHLYGTAYGHAAGFSINNRFRVYSSPDWRHWTFEGELLQSPAEEMSRSETLL
jgi:hypothetical protein